MLGKRGHGMYLSLGAFVGIIGTLITGTVLGWPFYAVIVATMSAPLVLRYYLFGPIGVALNIAYLYWLSRFVGVAPVVIGVILFIVFALVGRYL